MRKTIVTLVAALGLLVATTSASAAIIVAQGTTPPKAKSLSFNATNTTTAYALGVWTSNGWPEAIPPTISIIVSGNVDCVHNANDRFFSFSLQTSWRKSDAAYLWFGNRGIAGPWFGWDTCSIHVNLNAPGLSSDDRMVAWLVSHQ